MADVFISYKREERARVQRIARALQELGLSVWFDASLVGGGSFSSQINREVRAAKAVLVCWTPSAAHSEWVLGEAEIGRVRGVLAPTFLSHSDLPPPYNTLHAHDLCAWEGRHDDDEWLALLDRLGALIGRADLRVKAQAIASGAPVRAMGENIAQYAAPAFDMEEDAVERWEPGVALRFAYWGVAVYVALALGLTALGLNYFSGFGFSFLAGVTLAYAAPLAFGLTRAGALRPLGAVLVAMTIAIAHVTAVVAAMQFSSASWAPDFAEYARMGAAGGAVGSAISFVALLLFTPVLRNSASFVRLSWSVAALALLGALCLMALKAAGPIFTVEGGAAYTMPLVVNLPWQIGFSWLIVGAITASHRARALA